MKYYKIAFTIVLVVMLILSNGIAEEINWQVISSGGAASSSANYVLNGTVGQTATGYGSSLLYGLSHGYWQTVSIPGCCLLRGDVAEPKDVMVLVNDIVWLVDYLFKGGLAPTCLEEGDCAVPLDGAILVNDIVWLVDYLFKGGAAPPAC